MLMLGVVILSISCVNAIKKENYPNIQQSPRSCWRWPDNNKISMPENLHVCDPDQLLPAEESRCSLEETISLGASCELFNFKNDIFNYITILATSMFNGV